MGFAAIENVLYLIEYQDFLIAVQRAVLAIPAHLCFSVYMGLFYGRAKVCDARGMKMACGINLLAAYLVSATLHSIYDGILMAGGEDYVLYFYAFIVVLDLLTFYEIRHESRTDAAIY